MQQFSARLILLFCFLAVSLAACTSLKRFAYEGYKRDGWQQPLKVIESLEITEGSQVADVGAGGGYFTFKFAEAVGETGTVYAVDIDEGLLEYIAETAKEKQLANIKTVLATSETPKLPQGEIDLVFVCNTYHHLDERIAYFKNIHQFLQPTGRVAIIDFQKGWINSIGHGTETQTVVEEMQQAGFQLQQKFDFLEKQNFLLFVRAEMP
ncbi:class I SAM-dependent methyltransferase [Kaarinaea lacus]